MQKIFKITQKGFTLLEIIAILVVLGILAVIAVSRSVNYDAEVYGGADVLKSHLRYAQTLAMNSNPQAGITIWGISSNGSSYWLFQGTNAANPASYIRLPENDTYINPDRTINLTTKQIKFTANFTIYFDNRGIPYTAYVSATNNTPVSDTNPAIINVQPLNAATPNIAVTITPLTGYIQ